MNMIFNNTVRRVDYAPTRHGIKVRGKIFEYDLTIATTHTKLQSFTLLAAAQLPFKHSSTMQHIQCSA